MTRGVLHLMAGLGPTSGIANVARRFVRVQSERDLETSLLAPAFKWNPLFFDVDFALRAWRRIRTADEVWVHGSWTFPVWFGAWAAKRQGRRLIVVPSGSFDPLRLRNASGWKKRLVAPLDRRALRRADEVVALCEEEAVWIRAFEPAAHVRVMQAPLFVARTSPSSSTPPSRESRPLHVLFLGRAEDPLKGVRFLEEAVAKVNASPDGAAQGRSAVELRVLSNAVGAAKEAAWDWCDVLALPTLSENFGLVVAEALERGKAVLTTDGAPAWRVHFERHPESGVYLKGFREGDAATRVAMLAEALKSFQA